MITEKLYELIRLNSDLLSRSLEHPFLNCYYDKNIAPFISSRQDFIISDGSIESLKYTNFRSVDYRYISSIRMKVFESNVDPTVINSCNKLLRYIEVHFLRLRDKEEKHLRSREESIKLFNQVAALFVEYYLYTKDLRFLNASLKLMDLKWIKPRTRRNSQTATTVLHHIKLRQLEFIFSDLRNG